MLKDILKKIIQEVCVHVPGAEMRHLSRVEVMLELNVSATSTKFMTPGDITIYRRILNDLRDKIMHALYDGGVSEEDNTYLSGAWSKINRLLDGLLYKQEAEPLSDVKTCCFCGKNKASANNIIGSTKYEKDSNEGLNACDDCLSFDQQDYFQCEVCDLWYHYDSYGGSTQEHNITCRDCFKER
jgi:hypothetical protein